MSKVRMDWHCNSMLAAEKGGFVSYDDYAKLEAENAKLREIIAELTAAVQAVVDDVDAFYSARPKSIKALAALRGWLK